MNVCFELKVAVQVLLQRAVAGREAATLRRAPWHPAGKAMGKQWGRGRAEPLWRERGGKWGRVQSGKRGRGETLQDVFDSLILTLLWFVWIDFSLFAQGLGLAFSWSWLGSVGVSVVLWIIIIPVIIIPVWLFHIPKSDHLWICGHTFLYPCKFYTDFHKIQANNVLYVRSYHWDICMSQALGYIFFL